MMTTSTAGNLTRYLRHMLRNWEHEERTDAELLALFVRDRDEQAFATLVRRFSVLVWGACYRILGHCEEAEDAFQATFLVLARKAGQIRRKEVVGHWLYEVAQRTAQDVRKSLARRHRHEKQASTMLPTAYKEDVERPDLLAVLDEEIAQLPADYRLPLILCRLEGQTYAEAARSLGCSTAAVDRRVARAEELLRDRLNRRGVTLAGASMAVLLSQAVTAKGMPLCLVGDTIRAAQAFANSTLAPNLAVSIAQGVMNSMASSKTVLWGAVLVTLIGAAVGLVAQLAPKAQGVVPPEASAPPQAPSDEARRDRYGDPLPPGALARLGTVRLRHNDSWVHSLAFTADGKGLLTAGGDNLPRLWDVTTGKLIREFTNIPKPQWIVSTDPKRNSTSTVHHEVCGAVLSPDGRILAARSGDMRSLYILETATGKLLHEFKHERVIGETHLPSMNFAFSPDGKSIAAKLVDRLELRDVATGRTLWQKNEKDKDIVALAFSPDGKLLASADGSDGVRLWDARTGESLRALGHKRSIDNRIAFSPDGRTLAVGYSPSKDRKWWNVHLWDVATGKEVRQLGDPDRPLAFPVFSPDGKLMATCGGGAIRLWDAATGKELRRCPNTYFHWGPLAFSPDGKLLAAMDGPLVRFWEVASGKAWSPPRLSAGHEREVYSVAFTPDGRTLISGGGDYTIRWWDVRTGRQRLRLPCTKNLPTPPPAWAPRPVLSPDGTMLAAICTEAPDGEDNMAEIHKRSRSSICLWDAATGNELRRLDCGNGWVLEQLAFSPDGKVLAHSFCAVGGQSPVVRLWEVATGKRRERELLGTCPLFSPDGRILITLEGETDKAISFWETATGKKIHIVSTKECIASLALSPDGNTLAAGSDKITLYPLSWDKPSAVQVGAPRRVAYPPRWAVTALAFSPDGRMLASSGSDHNIYLWETVSGKERTRFQGHRIPDGVPGSLGMLSFSADGRRLASGGFDSTILIWDVTGQLGDRERQAAKLSDKEREGLWTDLASNDAARAGCAVWTLTAAGPSTVSFLKARLRPATARVSPETVARFIADLDAEDFHIRERARRELEKLGESCEPALRQVLAKQPSLEMRRSVQRLLSQLEEERKEPSGEVLRVVRTVEVLELIGTREARQVLETLTAGAPGASRTRETQAALERLDRGSRR